MVSAVRLFLCLHHNRLFFRHEHLYEELNSHLIRSDELPQDPAAMDRLLLNVNVILCTISMLSNPSLDQRHVFRLVPVQMLLIDEASQINVYDYMAGVILLQIRVALV